MTLVGDFSHNLILSHIVDEQLGDLCCFSPASFFMIGLVNALLSSKKLNTFGPTEFYGAKDCRNVLRCALNHLHALGGGYLLPKNQNLTTEMATTDTRTIRLERNVICNNRGGGRTRATLS